MNNREQRELLELEAQLLRLKVRSEQIRHNKAIRNSDGLTEAAMIAGNLLSDGLMLRAARIPTERRHRLLTAAAIAACRLYVRKKLARF